MTKLETWDSIDGDQFVLWLDIHHDIIIEITHFKIGRIDRPALIDREYIDEIEIEIIETWEHTGLPSKDEIIEILKADHELYLIDYYEVDE